MALPPGLLDCSAVRSFIVNDGSPVDSYISGTTKDNNGGNSGNSGGAMLTIERVDLLYSAR